MDNTMDNIIGNTINYSLILKQTNATIQVSCGSNLHRRVDNGPAESCVIKVWTVPEKNNYVLINCFRLVYENHQILENFDLFSKTHRS